MAAAQVQRGPELQSEKNMRACVCVLQEREPPSLDGMLDSMSTDLAGIRKDAEAAHSCLVTSDSRPSVTLCELQEKVTELREKLSETQKQLESKTRGQSGSYSASTSARDRVKGFIFLLLCNSLE